MRTLAILITVLALTACAGPRIGGYTVESSFSDQAVAKLAKAAIRGDRAEVLRLAKNGVPVNMTGHEDITPLLWTLYMDSPNGMEALLEAGANPNQKSIKGWSPLTWAAGGNKPDLLATLLRHGGDPNSDDTGRFEDRPLPLAASEGRLANVKLLLEAGADINVHDIYGHSAPGQAIAATGSYEVAAYLLERGYSHDIQELAVITDIRHVPPDSDKGRWKEIFIQMLKDRGAIFPAFIPCHPPGDPRRNEEDCRKAGRQVK